MLNAFRKLFGNASSSPVDKPSAQEPAPPEIQLDGYPAFPIAEHLVFEHGFPFLNWETARAWLDTLPDSLKGPGWAACERAWLLHLRDALGERYRLDEADGAILVSSLEEGPAQAALDFMQRTTKRILKVLDGVAVVQEWGADILVIFDAQDDYYRYVSHYYPEDGSYSLSGGMCLNADCVHFVTVKDDLHSVEPVIAHEMTHSMLVHLPLPMWLNEGLAVNTERRLSPQRADYEKQRELADKHGAFWGDAEIQEFWSGESFFRPDDGNALSYDLATAMVGDMARDWQAFRNFANAANAEDAGHQAAMEHLGIDLGRYVANFLERGEDARMAPAPDQWPERI